MDLGQFGIWTAALDTTPADQARHLAREVEDLGFGALWVPEATRREAFSNASLLLGATTNLVIATGVANIYARDALAMSAGWKTLTEAYPDRFLLGLGVGHATTVQAVRGHAYGRPLATMGEYLDAMDAAPFDAAPPTTTPRRVLAALGPKMLGLAAARAWGAHPFFVPPEHTRRSREILGPQALLAPAQGVNLETEPRRSAEITDAYMRRYLKRPHYVRNLRRLGYSTDDTADAGSRRLVEDIVAVGPADRVAPYITAHLEAGADHVCINVVGLQAGEPLLAAWRQLAKVLLAR
jgi:probable F420-dependent oxidoreductase